MTTSDRANVFIVKRERKRQRGGGAAEESKAEKEKYSECPLQSGDDQDSL